MGKIEEVKLKGLNNGDQIAVMGNVIDLNPLLLPFTVRTNHTYLHHGIFDKENFTIACESGRSAERRLYSQANLTVIEFHGDTKANARPKRRDFTEFFAGHTKLYRVVYEDGEKCLPVDETIQMEEKAIEQRSFWPAYDLIKNNCESFATYLKTGKASSKQVLEALKSWLWLAGPSAGGSFSPGDKKVHCLKKFM